MDIDVKQVSLFGMEYQRTRVEVASLNIANSHLVFSSEQDVTKPMQAVALTNDFSLLIKNGVNVELAPVVDAKAKAVFKPEHSLANEQGYIYKQNINIANEMVNLNEATRAYEANVKAFNTYREMGAKALEIGK